MRLHSFLSTTCRICKHGFWFKIYQNSDFSQLRSFPVILNFPDPYAHGRVSQPSPYPLIYPALCQPQKPPLDIQLPLRHEPLQTPTWPIHPRLQSVLHATRPIPAPESPSNVAPNAKRHPTAHANARKQTGRTTRRSALAMPQDPPTQTLPPLPPHPAAKLGKA